MSRAAIDRLVASLGEQVLATHDRFGDDTVVLAAPAILPAARLCHDALGMKMLMSLTVVDLLAWRSSPLTPLRFPTSTMAGAAATVVPPAVLDQRDVRFEVVYHLYAPLERARVRLKAPLVDVADGWPELDSVVSVWRNADWYERLAWDLYGVRFRGHPSLTRMFLPESFVGHPLRKDYPKEHRQPLVRRAALGDVKGEI